MKKTARTLSTLAVCGLAVSACTTTYTEADLRAEEARQDSDPRSEERIDREIGKAGGANLEAIRQEEEEVEDE